MRSGTARRWAAVVVVVAMAAAVVLAVRWCEPVAEYDREGAVNRVVAAGGGRISRSQAECYVDRVLAELGSGALERPAEPRPEDVPRLTGIRIDCIGVANLGSAPASVGTVPDVPGVSRPQRPGDDPRLDELYAQCEAGSGSACDELVDESPLGSEYESFGLTCGARTSEVRCAEVYPDPTTTTAG
jgi:hypothetical protein